MVQDSAAACHPLALRLSAVKVPRAAAPAASSLLAHTIILSKTIIGAGAAALPRAFDMLGLLCAGGFLLLVAYMTRELFMSFSFLGGGRGGSSAVRLRSARAAEIGWPQTCRLLLIGVGAPLGTHLARSSLPSAADRGYRVHPAAVREGTRPPMRCPSRHPQTSQTRRWRWAQLPQVLHPCTCPLLH